MKAMIFAAGLGTRLRPLTDHIPKALIPVDGMPMLARVILSLKTAGFTEIVVNIHHFGEQIIDYLESQQNFGVTLRISDERGELLDTGGGIKKARALLEGNEPFLVHNVDILTDADLATLYRQHLESRADATLLTNQRTTHRYLLTDTAHRLCGWTNVTTGEVLPAQLSYPNPSLRAEAFAGVHVLSPTLLRYMDAPRWQGKFSIIPFYISVCREANIQTFPAKQTHWFDIGKPETLAEAEAFCRGEK
ncbi:MAG: nucleotidyltransferase family protein [Mediterranea sp.]|jgi:NDP-sugar pyrophosphorylase family protein|nr:nucleotidyltransferase family protein [Mediterranea sp.]